MARRVAAVLAAAALLAGCSAGTDEPPTARATVTPEAGVPDASAGQALLAFLRAAKAREADTMWELLSHETRATAGGTRERFRGDLAVQLGDQFEHFEVEQVVLSRRLDEHGVVAVGGTRPPSEDEEPERYAYAAVLVEEGDEWRVDLGGLVIERLRPGPNSSSADEPELGARAAAAGRVERIQLWLNGVPVPAAVRRELPFVAELEAEPAERLEPGIHHAVVFAVGGGQAGAVAWPFEVE